MWKAARRMLAGYWDGFVKSSVLTNMPEWADVYEASRQGNGPSGAETAGADAAAVAGAESSENTVQETTGNV